MNDHTEDQPEFPPESQWLDCEPEQVGDDFVDRTIARLRDCALVQPDRRRAQDDRALARLDLPREWLDRVRPPTPSPDFVDSVMAGFRRVREEPLRHALSQFRVPEPSPEFVEQTLRALRRTPRSRLRLVATAVLAAAAAAAALVLVLATPTDARPSPESAVAIAVVDGAAIDGAAVEGPLLLAALIAADAHVPDELPIAPPGATVPWIRGGRR